jgi:hypothetical protein
MMIARISRVATSVGLTLLVLFPGMASAQTDIYIFAGQSNMQGAAPAAGAPAAQNASMVTMMVTNTGQWVQAKPVTSAYPGSGVGPALYFADRMAALTGHQIGIVNAAKGGTALWQWAPDYSSHSLYGTMIRLAKQAQQNGTLKGLLWYQGESDTDTAADVHAYGPRMHALFQAIRQDLGADLPIVFVQLGPHDPSNPAEPYWSSIQMVQQWIADGAPVGIEMVTAMDLSSAGSNSPHHLNTASQVILGGRMADMMYQIMP